MLVSAFAVFTLAITLGVIMAIDVYRGRAPEWFFSVAHVFLVLFGCALLTITAVTSDARIYINNVLAMVIIALGALLAIAHKMRKPAPKLVLFLHIGLALGFYALLGGWAFNLL